MSSQKPTPAPSLLARLWRKIRPARPAQAPAPATPAKPRKEPRAGLEPLEGRIAPATLINGSTLTYTDIDGDLVTIKFSRNILNLDIPEINDDLEDIFIFNTGKAHIGAANATDDVPQQLQLINLSEIPFVNARQAAAGVSISITAVRSPVGAGDDRVNIGHINANYELGSVLVDGDLAQIDAGVSDKTPGIKTLKVQSIGIVPNTQGPQLGTDDQLQSRVRGGIGSVTVEGDFAGYLNVLNNTRTQTVNGLTETIIVHKGSIGSLTIGGSLIGGSLLNSGTISVESDLGTVKIGDTLLEGLRGGSGEKTASLLAGGKIGTIKISGGLTGNGSDSARIQSGADITSITIGGAMLGSADDSAAISAKGKIGKITIGSHIRGGGGDFSGYIAADSLSSITIFGDLDGGSGGGDTSGHIAVTNNIGTVKITGSLLGGAGLATGVITAGGTIGTITIGGRIAGTTTDSGGIAANGSITKITLGDGLPGIPGVPDDGDALFGGTGDHSGYIETGGNLGTLTINTAPPDADPMTDEDASISGGIGDRSGFIAVSGKLGKLTLGNGISGGSGINSGTILVGSNTDVSGGIGTATIKGQITGGTENSAGAIISYQGISTLTLGTKGTPSTVNTLLGGTATFSGIIYAYHDIGTLTIHGSVLGGTGTGTGLIQAHGTAKNITINGNLTGGSAADTGAILIADRDLPGDTSKPGTLTKATITGNILGGTHAQSARIDAAEKISTLTLGGIELADGKLGGKITAGLGGIGTLKLNALLKGNTTAAATIETAGRIAAITLAAGADHAAIRAGDDIAALTSGSNLTSTTVTARGQAVAKPGKDIAIGTIKIIGNVADSHFLAGYDLTGPANADAQITAFTVFGTWTNSNLAAGVMDDEANGFGNGDDAKASGKDDPATIATIGKLIIGGPISATGPTAFTAEQIFSATVGGVKQPLDKLTTDPAITLAPNVLLREIITT